MIVLGIDPGTKLCGWALLEIGRGHASPVWLKGGHDAFADVANWIVGLHDDTQPDLVIVEKPAALHRGQANATVFDAAFIGGVMFGTLLEAGYECEVVSPPQVRASMLGVGKRGNQDALLKQLLERLVAGRPKRWNDHMRDAAAAAIVGHRMYQRRAA